MTNQTVRADKSEKRVNPDVKPTYFENPGDFLVWARRCQGLTQKEMRERGAPGSNESYFSQIETARIGQAASKAHPSPAGRERLMTAYRITDYKVLMQIFGDPMPDTDYDPMARYTGRVILELPHEKRMMALRLIDACIPEGHVPDIGELHGTPEQQMAEEIGLIMLDLPETERTVAMDAVASLYSHTIQDLAPAA